MTKKENFGNHNPQVNAAAHAKGAGQYQNVIVVDQAGNGDYTTLTEAMASIVDAGAMNRYAVMIYGNTVEPAGVITIKPFVSVIGSKRDTIVSCQGLAMGDGRTLQHRFELVNLYVTNSGGGKIGLDINQADEIIVRGCGFQSFETGVRIAGNYSSLIQFEDSSVSTSTLGFDLQFVTALHVRGSNLYDNDTVFKFSVANHVSVTDTAIETFETAALFDNTSAFLAVLSVLFHNCRFLSASGGESNTCRIVKSTSNADTYQGAVRGLVLRDCSFWLTNSKYLIEVNWNNHLSGGTNRFVAGLYNNYLQGESSPLNTVAWFKSDSPYAGFVHVDFGNNHAPNDVLVQDGGEPIVTGYAHRGLDAGSIAGSSTNGAGVLWGLNRWGENGSDTTRIEHGIAVLAAGTVTVSAPRVTYATRIFVQTIGPANAGWLVVQNVLPGKSFDIVSSNASDASAVAWLVVEP